MRKCGRPRLQRRLLFGLSVEDAQSKFNTPEGRAHLQLAHERYNKGIYHELQHAQRLRQQLSPAQKLHITRHAKPSTKGFQAYATLTADDFVVQELCWTRKRARAASHRGRGGHTVYRTEGDTKRGKLSSVCTSASNRDPLPSHHSSSLPISPSLSALEEDHYHLQTEGDCRWRNGNQVVMEEGNELISDWNASPYRGSGQNGATSSSFSGPHDEREWVTPYSASIGTGPEESSSFSLYATEPPGRTNEGGGLRDGDRMCQNGTQSFSVPVEEESSSAIWDTRRWAMQKGNMKQEMNKEEDEEEEAPMLVPVTEIGGREVLELTSSLLPPRAVVEGTLSMNRIRNRARRKRTETSEEWAGVSSSGRGPTSSFTSSFPATFHDVPEEEEPLHAGRMEEVASEGEMAIGPCADVNLEDEAELDVASSSFAPPSSPRMDPLSTTPPTVGTSPLASSGQGRERSGDTVAPIPSPSSSSFPSPSMARPPSKGLIRFQEEQLVFRRHLQVILSSLGDALESMVDAVQEELLKKRQQYQAEGAAGLFSPLLLLRSGPTAGASSTTSAAGTTSPSARGNRSSSSLAYSSDLMVSDPGQEEENFYLSSPAVAAGGHEQNTNAEGHTQAPLLRPSLYTTSPSSHEQLELQQQQQLSLVDRLVEEMMVAEENGYKPLSHLSTWFEPIQLRVILNEEDATDTLAVDRSSSLPSLHGEEGEGLDAEEEYVTEDGQPLSDEEKEALGVQRQEERAERERNAKWLNEAFHSPHVAIPVAGDNISFSLYVAGGIIKQMELMQQFPYHIARFFVSSATREAQAAHAAAMAATAAPPVSQETGTPAGVAVPGTSTEKKKKKKKKKGHALASSSAPLPPPPPPPPPTAEVEVYFSPELYRVAKLIGIEGLQALRQFIGDAMQSQHTPSPLSQSILLNPLIKEALPRTQPPTDGKSTEREENIPRTSDPPSPSSPSVSKEENQAVATTSEEEALLSSGSPTRPLRRSAIRIPWMPVVPLKTTRNTPSASTATSARGGDYRLGSFSAGSVMDGMPWSGTTTMDGSRTRGEEETEGKAMESSSPQMRVEEERMQEAIQLIWRAWGHLVKDLHVHGDYDYLYVCIHQEQEKEETAAYIQGVKEWTSHAASALSGGGPSASHAAISLLPSPSTAGFSYPRGREPGIPLPIPTDFTVVECVLEKRGLPHHVVLEEMVDSLRHWQEESTTMMRLAVMDEWELQQQDEREEVVTAGHVAAAAAAEAASSSVATREGSSGDEGHPPTQETSEEEGGRWLANKDVLGMEGEPAIWEGLEHTTEVPVTPGMETSSSLVAERRPALSIPSSSSSSSLVLTSGPSLLPLVYSPKIVISHAGVVERSSAHTFQRIRIRGSQLAHVQALAQALEEEYQQHHEKEGGRGTRGMSSEWRESWRRTGKGAWPHPASSSALLEDAQGSMRSAVGRSTSSVSSPSSSVKTKSAFPNSVGSEKHHGNVQGNGRTREEEEEEAWRGQMPPNLSFTPCRAIAWSTMAPGKGSKSSHLLSYAQDWSHKREGYRPNRGGAGEALPVSSSSPTIYSNAPSTSEEISPGMATSTSFPLSPSPYGASQTPASYRSYSSEGEGGSIEGREASLDSEMGDREGRGSEKGEAVRHSSEHYRSAAVGGSSKGKEREGCSGENEILSEEEKWLWRTHYYRLRDVQLVYYDRIEANDVLDPTAPRRQEGVAALLAKKGGKGAAFRGGGLRDQGTTTSTSPQSNEKKTRKEADNMKRRDEGKGEDEERMALTTTFRGGALVKHSGKKPSSSSATAPSFSTEQIFQQLCASVEKEASHWDLAPGDSPGYQYWIRLRKIRKEETPLVRTALQSVQQKGFINYFTPHRFSSFTQMGRHPGLALLKGEFQAAASMMVQQVLLDGAIKAEKERSGNAISFPFSPPLAMQQKGSPLPYSQASRIHRSLVPPDVLSFQGAAHHQAILANASPMIRVLHNALQAAQWLRGEVDSLRSPPPASGILELSRPRRNARSTMLRPSPTFFPRFSHGGGGVADLLDEEEDPCGEAFRRVLGPRACRVLIHEFLAFLWNDLVNQRIQRYGTFTILPGDVVRVPIPLRDWLPSSSMVDIAPFHVEGLPSSATNANGSKGYTSAIVAPGDGRLVAAASSFLSMGMGHPILTLATREGIAQHRYHWSNVVLPVPGAEMILPQNHTADLYVLTLKRYGIPFNPEKGGWDLFTAGSGTQGKGEGSRDGLGTKECRHPHPPGNGNALGLRIPAQYRSILVHPMAAPYQFSAILHPGVIGDPFQRWGHAIEHVFRHDALMGRGQKTNKPLLLPTTSPSSPLTETGGMPSSVLPFFSHTQHPSSRRDGTDGRLARGTSGASSSSAPSPVGVREEVSTCRRLTSPGSRATASRHRLLPLPSFPYWYPQHNDGALDICIRLPTGVCPWMLLRELTKSDVDHADVVELKEEEVVEESRRCGEALEAVAGLGAAAEGRAGTGSSSSASHTEAERWRKYQRRRVFQSRPVATSLALLHQHLFRSSGVRRSLLPTLRSYDSVSK